MNERREFIISPDKKYWDKNKPVLFAGDWCLDPTEREIWDHLDYKILQSNVFNTKENLKQIDICDEIYEKLLKELSIQLNEINKVNWSVRSWRITIGPWLERYVAIINNRLNLLKKAKENYTISFKNVQFEDTSLISLDLLDFTDKANSHEWNEKLIRRLDQLFTYKSFSSDFLDKNPIQIKFFEKKGLIKLIFEKIKIFLNFFWRFFPLTKKNNFLLHKIYIGNFFLSFKLFLKLKNFPVKFFFNEERVFKSFDIKIRNKLKINYNLEDINEKIIRYLLKESLPTLYLEGFKDMMHKVKRSHLPTNIKKIFTCNCWSDIVFKFWIAENINNGAKLYYGQHGSGYGMLKEHNATKHELKICDRFLTWGWTDKKISKNKITPCVSFPIIKEKIFQIKKKNDILLIPGPMDFYLFKNELKKPNLIYKDLDNLNFFIKNTNSIIYRNLAFKAHPMENRRKKEFSYFDYMKKSHPKVKLYKTSYELNKAIQNSKISIFFYLATPFLTNITLNKPSIFIYPNNFKEMISDEYLPIFQKLEEAKITTHNPIALADFINEKFNSIDEWWQNEKIQRVRNEASNIFAKKNENSLNILANSLKKN